MKTDTLKRKPGRLLISLACLFCATALQAAQLVTVHDPSHLPAAGGNGDSAFPLISHDGRFVLFTSSADNLVLANTNAPVPSELLAQPNAFLRDRSNAVTTLLSVNLTGMGGGNGASFPGGISANGRYVLLETSASDLFPDDTNNASDVLVRDLQSGTNLLVSVATNGLPGNGDSYSAVMTPDARFVAFVSAANNLVADDTNGIPDVFVRDLLTGTTTLASVGAQSVTGSSEAPELTPDGRYVVFFSSATNLVAGIPGAGTPAPVGGDIYVRDLVGNTTIWASSYARTALQSFQNTANAVSFSHVISANGSYVAYEVTPISSSASGIVLRYSLETGLTDVISTNATVSGPPENIEMLAMSPDGRFIAFAANQSVTTQPSCVYVWDALSGTTTLASSDLTGATPTQGRSVWPAITPDGRYVAFASTATNLVTNSLSGEYHLLIRDMQSNVTALVDADTNGFGSGVVALTLPSMSDDGQLVAFEANDGSLVSADYNQCADVFVRSLATGVTELISVRDPAFDSLTPNGPSILTPSSVSAQGNLVAFASDASDLIPNDTNGYRDVFVRDLVADSTWLVSADTSGTASGNSVSLEPVVSADGRYVAFSSMASNLVTGDLNNVSDVFVRDLLTAGTLLVSVNTNDLSGNGASYTPTISSNGQAVLFHSLASDLAPGSVAGGDNLFWRNLTGNTTYLLSPSPYSAGTNPAAMTPDGRYVAFGSSTATWYVWDSQVHALVYTNTDAAAVMTGVAISPDGNRVAYAAGGSLYLEDRAVNTNTPLGTLGSALHGLPRFSADGHYLAYVTSSANVPTDTNGLYDVYLYNCLTSSNLLVSQAFNSPASANGNSDTPDISADGRFVAYRSAAANLVPNDTNGVPDVFLWDRLTGATLLLSGSPIRNSTADERSSVPVFSGDGSTVLFTSWASDIVSPDFNRVSDLFAVTLLSANPIPVFQATVIPGASFGQGVWLTWPVVAGRFYSVQFKDSLQDPGWQDLLGGVTIVGTQAYFNDPVVPGGQRFYRIVAQ